MVELRGQVATVTSVFCIVTLIAGIAQCAPRNSVDRQHLQSALDLNRKMRTEGACSEPRARVVYVTSVLPSSVKKYSPPATILHVCEAAAGCCFNEQESCQPKTIEKVQFWFQAFELSATGKTKAGVESLSFFNHTECECQKIGAGIFR